jgi:hypothetical protein
MPINTRSGVLLLLLSVFMLAGLQPMSAAAQEANWRLVQRVGNVFISPKGSTLPGTALALGTVITTGQNGRVILSRAGQQIVLQPNSRIELTPDAGSKTSLQQTLGAAIFKVDKRKQPHFEVNTPFLAAIVKGTEFSVTVTADAAEVDVLQGSVETRSVLGSALKLLRKGMKARVTAASPRQIDFLGKSGQWQSISENEGSWRFRDKDSTRSADNGRETLVSIGGSGDGGGTHGGGQGGGSVSGWSSGGGPKSGSAPGLRRTFDQSESADRITVRLSQGGKSQGTGTGSYSSAGFATGPHGASAQESSTGGIAYQQKTFLDRELLSGNGFFKNSRVRLDAEFPWTEFGYGILALVGLLIIVSLLKKRRNRTERQYSSDRYG